MMFNALERVISTFTPQAFAAVAALPTLARQVAPALAAQERRCTTLLEHYVPRPSLTDALEQTVATFGSGVLALEAPHGSGVTSLLCALAVRHRWPLWLPAADGGRGAEALCAQLLAVHHIHPALVPPPATHDPAVLERLLAEAAQRSSEPLVVLIGRRDEADQMPEPPPMPRTVPPNVVIVWACAPGEVLRLPVATRIVVPKADQQIPATLEQCLVRAGVEAGLVSACAERSNGSLLYCVLAAHFLQTGLLGNRTPPQGLAGLYRAWWRNLDVPSRRLAGLVAAGPLPLALCGDLARMKSPRLEQTLASWGPLIDNHNGSLTFAQQATRTFVAAQSDMAETHALVAEAALASDGEPLLAARHLSLAGPFAPPAPAVLQRSWIAASERATGDTRAVATDARWMLRRAAQIGAPVPLARAAALAGTLGLLARRLPADSLAEAFNTAIAAGLSRDAALRRVSTLLDSLPETPEKAAVLRRLGEVCYEIGMRPQAMRMLSEALDLEVPGLPRAWRDEREETLVAFARSAISGGAAGMALAITTRISHPERRGLIETEVVRQLIATGQHTRAEEVAYAIGHSHTHEWAMAEVAVGHDRAGNHVRADEVLGTLRTATAVAWARGELACDRAARGDADAPTLVAHVPVQHLRDRALGDVARALVAGGAPQAALACLAMIEDPAARTRAAIDMALLPDADAAQALSNAEATLPTLSSDDYTPLAVALCAAYGSAGDQAGVVRVAQALRDEDVRDRAYSRAAAALARRGSDAADQLIGRILDDDERDWTLHDMVRLHSDAGNWRGAGLLVDQIRDGEQRARAEADMCIARARAGNAPLAAELAALIAAPDERVRALTALAEPLVRQGAAGVALDTIATLPDSATRSRYTAVLAAALATNGQNEQAATLAMSISSAPERAKGLLAVARAGVASRPAQSLAMFGQALRAVAVLGRTETYACLAQASDLIAALGGHEALLTIAHALDEIDEWWG